MVTYLKLVVAFFDQHPWAPSFVTIIVTVVLAAWQINRQFKNTLNLQRTNKLDELHLQIYRDISEKIAACEDSLSSIGTSIRILPYAFESKIYEDKIAQSAGLAEASYTIKERAPVLIDNFYIATSKVSAVISVMEQYEIAFCNFITMKDQIFDILRKIDVAFSNFYSLVWRYLPMEVKDEDEVKLGFKIFNPPLPDAETLKQIYSLAETCNELSMTLAAYLHDLRIETQNELISPIFGDRKAVRRVPGDARHQVLTRDKSRGGD